MIPYTLHVAIILAVCLGFYKLLLGGQTYYRLNRLVLLACLVLAFVLPFIPVSQQFSLLNADQLNTPVYQTVVPATVAGQHLSPSVPSIAKQEPQILNRQVILGWAVWLYWFGMTAFSINFLLQAAVLVYQSWKNESIRDGRYHIVELETDKAPCSFGSYIFINPAKYDWDTYNRILMHEKVHVKERHSIDLILTELMLVFQWFNPFAWLYRKTVENNLEFLTDDTVLQQHQVDPAAYQWSLLQVSVPNYAVRLATNYNQSLLKKRIMMMDAKRSDVHTLWKYVMLLPVLALLVCGLNKPVALSKPLIAKPGIALAKPVITAPKIQSSTLKHLSVRHYKLKEPSPHQQVALILFAAGLITDTSDFTVVINRYILRVSGVVQPEDTRKSIFQQLTAKKLMTDQLIIIGSPLSRGSNPSLYADDTSKHPYGNGYVQPRGNGYVQPHANGYVQPYAQRYGQYYTKRDTERRAAEKAAEKAITADMLKDGLITQTHQFSFVLSGRSLTINGQRQPQDVFEKYKRKYVPANGGPNWTWSHSQSHDGSHNDIDD